MKKAGFVLLMLVASIGCLEKTTTQTIYIEGDGSVTWVVLESDVYSSADNKEDRLREENEYLRRALAGRPDIVEGLTEIGGADVRAELLRDRRPFSLRATARFQDLEHAFAGFFQAAGIGAEVRLQTDDGRHVLTIVPIDIEPVDEDEDPVFELFRSDDFRFIVTDGEFQEAVGFSIEEQGRVAIWTDDADVTGETPTEMRLVWTTHE